LPRDCTDLPSAVIRERPSSTSSAFGTLYEYAHADPRARSVHVHIAEEQRRTDWEHHRGTASLILPEYYIGRNFLEKYGEDNGWALQGRKLHFSQADRKPAEGMVESLRRLPWLPPDEVEQRNAILNRLARPIVVRSLDFGRPCRDGVLSVEHSVDLKLSDGSMTFDAEFALFRITDGKHIMVIRCDIVEHVVADDDANAILLILRMPPAFEQMPDVSAPSDLPKPPSVPTGKNAPKKVVPGMASPSPPSSGLATRRPSNGAPVNGKAGPRKPVPGAAPNGKVVPGMASTMRAPPGLRPPSTSPSAPMGTGPGRPPASTNGLARTPSPEMSTRPPPGLGPPRLGPPPGLAGPSRPAWSSPPANGNSASSAFAGAVDAALEAVQNGRPAGASTGGAAALHGGTATPIRQPGTELPPPWRGLRSRTTRFNEKHRNLAPFSSRAIRVAFGQADAVFDFEDNSEKTWTGFPVSERTKIPFVTDRRLYSAKNRGEIPRWLKKLPLCLAMQLDALFINAILDPLELISLRKHVDVYLTTLAPEALAHAIQIFAEDITQTDHEQAPIWGAQLDFVAMLANAVDRVTGQQAILPVHKYMVRTFHLYLTPSTMILEGPYPSESSALASLFLRSVTQRLHTDRILRRWGDRVDCFLRITFCEESRREYRWERNVRASVATSSAHSLMRRAQIDWQGFLQQRVQKVLHEGCIIAGRQYEFLGYSMSSLRMRCVHILESRRKICKGDAQDGLVRYAL
jgi:hypothetical protein